MFAFGLISTLALAVLVYIVALLRCHGVQIIGALRGVRAQPVVRQAVAPRGFTAAAGPTWPPLRLAA